MNLLKLFKFISKSKNNYQIIDEDISDGYHTFAELYKYRLLYNAAFANLCHNDGIKAVKSFRHSDGELCFGGGWFVVYIQLPTGQITNHYKTKYWHYFKIPKVDKAPTYDWHTPQDVASRLEEYVIFKSDTNLEH